MVENTRDKPGTERQLVIIRLASLIVVFIGQLCHLSSARLDRLVNVSAGRLDYLSLHPLAAGIAGLHGSDVLQREKLSEELGIRHKPMGCGIGGDGVDGILIAEIS